MRREANCCVRFTRYEMRILITAGPTREYIDPVRFISNASSGRMACALARAAVKAGHRVTLITAPTSQKPPRQVAVIDVETAVEMFKAVKKHFEKCDCLIMAAAVADYTPVRPAKTKIKKQNKPLTIKLKPTADILKWAGRCKRKDQIVVGFALEDKALRSHAERKLKQKHLDMIIANTPAAIASDRSVVHLKRPDSPWVRIDSTAKDAIAGKIVRLIENL